MNTLGKLFFLIICLVGPVWALSDPQLIVKGTADQLMREVRLKKVELEADPQKVYLLADKYASPYFDYSAMTQSAVGSFWRQASDKQKRELTNQFKQLLESVEKASGPTIPWEEVLNTSKATLGAVDSLIEGKWISIK